MAILWWALVLWVTLVAAVLVVRLAYRADATLRSGKRLGDEAAKWLKSLGSRKP